MSNMQQFYDRLFSEQKKRTSNWRRLLRITRANRGQLSAMKGAPSWSDWVAPSL